MNLAHGLLTHGVRGQLCQVRPARRCVPRLLPDDRLHLRSVRLKAVAEGSFVHADVTKQSAA
jgi:hypothetical protein